MQDFRKIEAWHKAHALALDVHRTLTKHRRVDAHLRSQISKAARGTANTVEVRKMLYGFRNAVLGKAKASDRRPDLTD